MLPLLESAVLTGQIRLQSENYFNKSKLNTLLSIFSLQAYFDSGSVFCRADVAVNLCTHFLLSLPLFLKTLDRKEVALAHRSPLSQRILKAPSNPCFC